MADENKKDVKKESAKKNSKKRDWGAWFREMRGELNKVVWPSRQTVVKNTGTVLLCSLVVGAFIWVFDFASSGVVQIILALARQG